MAKLTFHLTKGEWDCYGDRIRQIDCLVGLYEEFYSEADWENFGQEKTEKFIRKLILEIFYAKGVLPDNQEYILMSGYSTEVTVTFDPENKDHVEILNEAIEGSVVESNMRSNLIPYKKLHPNSPSHYFDYFDEDEQENIKRGKSIQRHLRNINKKLNALNCDKLHARWGV